MVDEDEMRAIDARLDRDHERSGRVGSYTPYQRRPTSAAGVLQPLLPTKPPTRPSVDTDPCPNDHEALKADPTLFAELEQLGAKALRGGGTLHFANCNLCHSTLCRREALS